MKRQNRILLLLAGMMLSLTVVISQEPPYSIQSVQEMNVKTLRPIALEPLAVDAHKSGFGINAGDKDLMYAGGGFEGDGQKTIPVSEGAYILIACALIYGLVKRESTLSDAN